MVMLNDEQLANLKENELKDLFIGLRKTINESRRLKKPDKELEIYYCYVVRELEKRITTQKINL